MKPSRAGNIRGRPSQGRYGSFPRQFRQGNANPLSFVDSDPEIDLTINFTR